MSRFAWFATETGKKFVFGTTCTTGIGFLVTFYIPHTFLLKKYKDLVQLYSFGMPVALKDRVLKRTEKVMEDMKIPPLEKKLINFFSVYGFNTFHAGSTYMHTGAVIGLPSNFNYETTEDIDKQNIIVKTEPVDWTTNAAESLKESLVLSESAQKYAIAEQISQSRTMHVYLKTLYPPVVLLAMYTVGHSININQNLFSRPLKVRMIMYTLLTFFGFGLWSFLHDFTTVQYEIMADKQASSLGKEYIVGGVEYYEKLMKRNVALRSLLGKSGPKLYTATGNQNMLIRQKHIPLSYRKDYLDLRLKELREEAIETM